MPLPNEPLRIGSDELYATNVEDYLEQRREAKRMLEEFDENSGGISNVFFASWFYLAIACSIGAFLAWAALEPFFNDGGQIQSGAEALASFLLFPTVAGMIGLFLGAAEGVMCRNPSRAALCGIVGLAIGFLGGIVALFAAGIIFAITAGAAVAIDPRFMDGEMHFGLGLLVLMMGRAAAWSLAALPAGLGQGIALRNKKVAINGLVGGVLGGLFGGMLFDPISMIFTTGDGQATMSRMVGFMVIGLGVGVFVGLVESWTKTAWLQMRAGPLTGKQFIIFRDTTVMGSSPKADIYLFKDPEVEPRHATLYNRGGRFEIEDMGTPAGTYVNGKPVQQRMSIQNGDQIQLGKTVLEFVIREQSG